MGKRRCARIVGEIFVEPFTVVILILEKRRIDYWTYSMVNWISESSILKFLKILIYLGIFIENSIGECRVSLCLFLIL